MKQFNIEDYVQNPNRKVVTRDGHSVRIICTDRISDYPVVALVSGEYSEDLISYTNDGKVYTNLEDDYDLFFAPESKTKKVGWMNVCKYGDDQHFSLVGGVIHPTREQAMTERPDYVVGTIQIKWEEK